MTAERLDAFMARANAIYYATHDPFTDFTTAPEISQVFGELIGAWIAFNWQHLGQPDPLLLIEAGPGRGTLMADVLRTVRQVAPPLVAALQVHLIETSARLRTVQAARIPQATWHDALDTVPDGPMILLANEFLDALPIRQFVRRTSGWTERFVLDGAWLEHPADPDVVPPARHGDIGQVVELNQAARNFVAAVADRIRRTKGLALLIDYGPARSAAGDSLQAIANGRPTNPLSPPGTSDLTAHVDFADLAAVARASGAAVQGPVTQAAFLNELGLFPRTEALARGRQPEPAMALRNAALRLADPDAMGDLFKVMLMAFSDCPPLPGMATAIV